jgi:hypothetical protein
VGRRLTEALARLRASGAADVRIIRTRPPWAGRPTGDERVVRQRFGEVGVELVVAAEGYLRERE